MWAKNAIIIRYANSAIDDNFHTLIKQSSEPEINKLQSWLIVNTVIDCKCAFFRILCLGSIGIFQNWALGCNSEDVPTSSLTLAPAAAVLLSFVTRLVGIDTRNSSQSYNLAMLIQPGSLT